jgi:hypothetical protein
MYPLYKGPGSLHIYVAQEFTEEPVVGIHMGQTPLLRLCCIITYQTAITKFTVAGSRIGHLLVLLVRSLKLIKNGSTEEQNIKNTTYFLI